MYVVSMTANISWVGDGASAMSVPSAQTLQFQVTPQAPAQVLPATWDVPTQTEFQTAVTLAATTINNLITAAVTTRLQGFATGGG